MREVFLLEGFPVSSPRGFLGWANALLLDDGRTRIVIDTGGPGDRGQLIKRMEEIGLDPSSVAFLILTHLHFDHSLNLDLFSRAIIVLGHREYDYVSGGAYRGAGDAGISPAVIPLLKERELHLVDELTAITQQVSVLPTPGHTPGSVSVLYETGGVRTIACADLVKNGREFLNGPPSAEGKLTLSQIKHSAVRWVPGHDRPFFVDGTGIRYEGMRELELELSLNIHQPLTLARWRFE